MDKEKILIIEDEAILLDSVSTMLDANFYVIEAVNGSIGLQKALETKPDLIILDLLLPKMSGEDLLMELRKDPWGANAKVLVITNLQDPDIKRKMLKLNVVDYLLKSNISLEMLNNIVLKSLHPDKPVYFKIDHV